ESPGTLPGPCLAPKKRPRPRAAEAEAIEKELLEDYRFGRQQLIEIWGHACAVAVTKVRERGGELCSLGSAFPFEASGPLSAL
uniref:Uncharacterized protein n=1 Tax=Anas platyrhynchos platyrhynchos TaxID=8840 RepID=A0A493TRT4_ANAPP